MYNRKKVSWVIKEGIRECPDCGGELKRYDSLKRPIKGKQGAKKVLYLDRYECMQCGKIHRELPDNVYPYKRYEAAIIDGVREGLITSETVGFEDYPCESTMKRWRTQKLLVIL